MEPGDHPPSPRPANEAYINRDLSDLAYVRRILEQAQSESTPLAERLRFIGISSMVLDEFVAVRWDKVDRSVRREVERGVAQLRAEQFRTLTDVCAALATHGIHADIAPFARPLPASAELSDTFSANILPAVTPIAIDREHPFPFLQSQQLSLIADVFGPKDQLQRMLIPLPQNLAALIFPSGPQQAPISTERLIASCLEVLLPEDRIGKIALFRIIRANDIKMAPDFADLRHEVERGLDTREQNPVVCIELNSDAPSELREFVADQLLGDDSGFVCLCPYPGIAPFAELQTWIEAQLRERGVADAFYPAQIQHQPAFLAKFHGDWFAAMREGDLLLHWPYDDFAVQLDLLRQAASDSSVIAIKQTLYRTDTAVIEPLIHAANNGKEVTVVLELEARDSEQQNVTISHALERAGVRVIYGIIDLKIHAKLLLIVRKENAGLREYANFATGNYHTGNARQYSDLSLFTAHPGLGRDMTRLFNYITGNLTAGTTEDLVIAPTKLRAHLLSRIQRETDNAAQGIPSGIWIKLNSLLDHAVIDALYAAAQAGVPIKAVIRRHCALRPGIAQLSPGIEVKSLIGRYLEHARIVCFANGKALPSPQADVYLGSADWMPRNFDQRVEVLVPVLDERLRTLLMEDFLDANFRDTQQSWVLGPDGSYQRQPPGFCAQSYFAATPLGC